MAVHTTDTWTPQGARFMAQMLALKSEPYVKVGVLGEQASQPKQAHDQQEVKEPATLVQVAIYQEFGTKTIPERSFLRVTADKMKDKWHEVAEKLQEQMIEKGMTTERALGIMGLRIQRDVQDEIRANIPPPLKYREGIALIDTGQLINSISPQVVMNGQAEK